MKRYIYGLIISVLAVSVGLTSCLNDDMIDNQKYGLINLNANKILEIPSTATHTLNITSLDKGIIEYEREVRLAAEQPATEDLVVNLEVIADTAIIRKAVRDRLGDLYPISGDNAVADEDILIYPKTGITIPETVTIPKGQRSVKFKVQVDSHILIGAAQFLMIGVKGANKAGYIVSGNFGNLLMNMKVMSIYDGIYTIKGYSLRAGDALKTGLFAEYEMPLVTSTATAVEFGVLQQWADGTGVGIGYPVLTVDASNNVTISSSGGAINDPNYNSRYDPTNKTFYVSFTWGAGPTKRLATDTLTYVKPR